MKKLTCLAAHCMLLWFLADAGGVRAAVSQALALCAGTVIPSLFPFLVVTTLLVSLGFGQLLSPLLEGLMVPLFRVPGCGASALVLGLIGGYPIGAKTAADLYRTNQLSRNEAERLLTFCNNSNPVFLISVLGSGVFGSVRTGVWLWLIHLAAALLTGLCFRGGRTPDRRQIVSTRASFHAVSLPAAFVEAVRSSLTGILNVCAFVLFFYVLASPLWEVCPPLVGILELFSVVPLLENSSANFVLAAGLAGWGGVSVLCQTAAVLEGSGLSIRPAALGKVLHGLFSAVLAALLVSYM